MKLFWLMGPTETGGGGLSCRRRDLRVGGGGACASEFSIPGPRPPGPATAGLWPPALGILLTRTVDTAPSSWPRD